MLLGILFAFLVAVLLCILPLYLISKLLYKKNRENVINFIKDNIGYIIMVIVLIALFVLYLNSDYKWEKEAYEFLDVRYEGVFEITDYQRDDRKIIFDVITKDENKIEFKLFAEWGTMNTPMGPTVIPNRIFYANLSEELSLLIEDGTQVYDVTDKSAEEVAIFIEKKLILLSETYQEYDIPHVELTFILKNGETTKSIKFKYPRNRDYIKRKLFEELRIQ